MLDRTAIRELGEQELERLISTPPQQARRWGIRMTSGTSSVPVIVAHTYGAQQDAKFNRSRNLAVSFGALSVRLSNTLIFSNGAVSQRRVLCVDQYDLTPELPALFRDFAPDTICGLPSLAAKVGEWLGTAGGCVELLQLSGERLMPAVQKILTGYFPRAWRMMAFHANEIGSISSHGCPQLPLNHYHPGLGVCVEILNPDEAGAGELLITRDNTAGAGGVSVEKYSIGDTARMVSAPCPCGAEVTFEHLGRAGFDYIKIMGVIIRREEFDRVALLFKNTIDDYRVEAGEVPEKELLKGKVVLRVYSRQGIGTPALAEEIARDFAAKVFVTPTRTLADIVAQGVFLPMVVEFTAAPFPVKHKDVKLSRV